MTKNEVINILMAADNDFAMSLAVTLRSLVDHQQAVSLHVFILSNRISEESKSRIRQSVSDKHVTIQYIEPGVSELDGQVFLGGHIQNLVVYSRLYVADLLPQEIEKIIYVDSDMLVLSNLSELWHADFDGYPIMAVREAGQPNFREGFHPKVLKELGISPDDPVFNSGFMVMDLRTWREKRIGERAIELAVTYKDYFRYWDQCALNGAVQRDWKSLPLEWNVQSQALTFPSARASWFGDEEWSSALSTPRIIHFNGPWKPWNPDYFFPYRRLFLTYLEKTAWKETTPNYKPIERARAFLLWPYTLIRMMNERWKQSRSAGRPCKDYPFKIGLLFIQYPWLLMLCFMIKMKYLFSKRHRLAKT